MNNKRLIKKYIQRILLLVVLAGAVFLVVQATTRPGKYDSLAQCITDSGAKFYGAFWCPHCQSQKKMFGKSQKKLPYVECSTPNGRAQKQVCTDAGIEGYPTWELGDGTRLSGALPLETLSEITSCALPTAQN